MCLVFDIRSDIKSILLMGGGAYSWPKWVLSNHPDVSIDVVDPDESCEDIAREFFFLDEVISEKDERLRSFVNDGRNYLSLCTEKYDVIVNDASSGEMFASDLMTYEAISEMKAHLNKDGVIMVNAPGRVDTEQSSFLFEEISTLKTLFPYVSAIRAQGWQSGNEVCNYVLFASDAPLDLKEEISIAKEGLVLKDEDLSEFDDTFII
jgi:spermidine synthase